MSSAHKYFIYTAYRICIDEGNDIWRSIHCIIAGVPVALFACIFYESRRSHDN